MMAHGDAFLAQPTAGGTEMVDRALPNRRRKLLPTAIGLLAGQTKRPFRPPECRTPAADGGVGYSISRARKNRHGNAADVWSVSVMIAGSAMNSRMGVHSVKSVAPSSK